MVKIKGELELDIERKVIYFHSYEDGRTILRICQIPWKLLVSLTNDLIDINCTTVSDLTRVKNEQSPPQQEQQITKYLDKRGEITVRETRKEIEEQS